MISSHEKTISYLLDRTARSGLNFFRNRKKYSGEQMASHLLRKFRLLRKKISSPEDFIRKIASKSLTTGHFYRVETSQNQYMFLKEWFRNILPLMPEESECVPSENENKAFCKVMTLNIAHAKKGLKIKPFHKKYHIKKNLDRISSVIKREDPHIVALQEAECPSFRENNFDHVEYISSNAGYTHSFCGSQVKKRKYFYGQALLSKYPFILKKTFHLKSGLLTPVKGFVVSTVELPLGNTKQVMDIISIHLDFSRAAVRRRQIREVIAELKKRKYPFIVMGDFNCGVSSREQTLRYFISELRLNSYNPYGINLETFPLLRRRLDWILLSNDLKFVSHSVIRDKISDHYAVVAEIAVT